MSLLQRRKAQMYFAAAAGLGLAGAAQAATFTWNGAADDSNWNNPANWTAGSGAPGAADVASWSGGSTPSPTTVDLAQNESALQLNVAGKDVTFNLNNFTLTVGGEVTAIANEQSVATINGPGTAIFTSRITIGNDSIAPGGEVTGHAVMQVTGGARVESRGGVWLGDYRTGGILRLEGAGTQWINSGEMMLGRSGMGGRIATQPGVQLHITNGANFTHVLGDYGSSNLFNANSSSRDVLVQIDGEGSRFDVVGSYGYHFQFGNRRQITVNIVNGGVFSAPDADIRLAFDNNNAYTTTVNVGAGSKMTAAQFALAARSHADYARGSSLVNVAGLMETTNADALHAIAVGNRGTINLQGGTISIPQGTQVSLLHNTSVTDASATLQGTGTIAGGNLYVYGASIVKPGGDGATGAIVLDKGNLQADAAAQLEFELSTDASAAYDSIVLQAAGSSANIAGLLSYANLAVGSGAQAAGILDFIVADTIAYNTGTDGLNLSSGDIPLDADNLDSLLQAEGYVRVFGTPVNLGEYRYYIANDVLEDSAGGLTLDALRLEIAPIPEPGALSLLAMGGLLMIRRRRA